MSHKIEEVDSKYNVTEVRSTGEERIIKTFNDKDEAKKFRRFLNLGGGFDNWTPDFFLVNPQIN
jgi:hypothetical protein